MATSKEISAGYDENTTLPAEWKNWPTAPRAAKLLGCSIRHLVRHVERGTIERHQGPDGTFRYNPDELEDAKSDILENIQATSDEGRELVVTEGFKSGTELVKQSHKHAEMMFGLYKDPINQLLEMFRKENETLRTRVTELEKVRDENAQKREELISEQHMREILTAKVLKGEARKEKAFGLVIDKIPSVFDKFVDSHLGQSKEVKATIELLKGFDKESLAMLLETEIVTEEQKAHIRTILNMPQTVPSVKPDDDSKPVVETTSENAQ